MSSTLHSLLDAVEHEAARLSPKNRDDVLQWCNHLRLEGGRAKRAKPRKRKLHWMEQCPYVKRGRRDNVVLLSLEEFRKKPRRMQCSYCRRMTKHAGKRRREGTGKQWPLRPSDASAESNIAKVKDGRRSLRSRLKAAQAYLRQRFAAGKDVALQSKRTLGSVTRWFWRHRWRFTVLGIMGLILLVLAYLGLQSNVSMNTLENIAKPVVNGGALTMVKNMTKLAVSNRSFGSGKALAAAVTAAGVAKNMAEVTQWVGSKAFVAQPRTRGSIVTPFRMTPAARRWDAQVQKKFADQFALVVAPPKGQSLSRTERRVLVDSGKAMAEAIQWTGMPLSAALPPIPSALTPIPIQPGLTGFPTFSLSPRLYSGKSKSNSIVKAAKGLAKYRPPFTIKQGDDAAAAPAATDNNALVIDRVPELLYAWQEVKDALRMRSPSAKDVLQKMVEAAAILMHALGEYSTVWSIHPVISSTIRTTYQNVIGILAAANDKKRALAASLGTVWKVGVDCLQSVQTKANAVATTGPPPLRS